MVSFDYELRIEQVDCHPAQGLVDLWAGASANVRPSGACAEAGFARQALPATLLVCSSRAPPWPRAPSGILIQVAKGGRVRVVVRQTRLVRASRQAAGHKPPRRNQVLLGRAHARAPTQVTGIARRAPQRLRGARTAWSDRHAAPPVPGSIGPDVARPRPPRKPSTAGQRGLSSPDHLDPGRYLESEERCARPPSPSGPQWNRFSAY
jgi:hypothetical protein